MTAESDFRDNTRAMNNLAKKIDNLFKVSNSLNSNLVAAIIEMRSKTEADKKEVDPVKGMSLAEAGQNLQDNTALAAICHRCFTGMCMTGAIYNDKCACCNKSHRKS